MAALYAVIMAGGRGERFWPLSTGSLTKPFIPLLGSSSLIQDTVARIEPLVPLERVLISIGPAHLEVARQQLPGIPAENFIVEPVGRDTSASIGYCALHIERRDPEGRMLALPADHYVSDPAGFRKTLELGCENLEGCSGIVFGIRPDRPETGYGYVLAEKPAVAAAAWPVVRFVEKPDAARAARFVASGDYFWNSGMFLWDNRILLGLFEKHMPDVYRILRRLSPLLGAADSGAEVNRLFAALPRVSIDFGIMEKTVGLRLIPAQFAWDDIGNWASLERALPADSMGNIVHGSHAVLDSRDCVVYARTGKVAVFGVSDLIVVEAYGKVLVCSKDKAAELKRLVTALGPEEG